MIRQALLASALLASMVLSGCGGPARAEAPPKRLPSLAGVAAPTREGLETAVFAGGCFWGVQGVFSHVKGVTRAISGYAGGAQATAHYDVVSTGLTGHAESVQVTFDPKVVSYPELMRIFFSVALDPTEVGGQNPDHGPQYRSMLWVGSDAQRRQAAAYIHQLDATHAFAAPVATGVEPLKAFYPAEVHHQDFFARHPDHPYIQAWDLEKVTALKNLFPERYSSARATGV